MKCPIPEEALSQHAAILGKTGSGKTYAWKVAVEHLLQHGKRVAIVDPTGAWWGLRSSADGKRAGFPVLVLGGDHGDLPLPALGGAAVARLVAEQGVSLIADTSALTVGERTRWFIDFGTTLYRLNRAPLHLVLDEAHNFAPQGKVPDPDTGRMLHAANTLASGGRSRGIRLAMITQRPQKLHKDALTSADTLVAMRVLAPHDREAVRDWIRGCGDEAQGKQVLDSLASLQRGEGWVWYPEGGYLKRLKFPPIGTFDSSATPVDGHVREAPKSLAEIDLSAVRAALEDAVKEAEANDPKLLRRKIADLEAQARDLREHPAHVVDPGAEERGYERGVAVGRAEVLAHRPALELSVEALDGAVARAVAQVRAALEPFARQLTEPPPARSRLPAVVLPAAMRHNATPPAGPGAPLPRAERLILTALAQYPVGRTAVQVAVLTGYAAGGGGFRNALGALRSAGRLDGNGDRLMITTAGKQALGSFTPLPVGRALLEHWMGQLPKAERKSLEALAEVYPKTLSVAQVAARAGYDAGGGGFRNALGRLRTLELVRGRGELRASEDLFS
jgi:hypothetical protein